MKKLSSTYKLKSYIAKNYILFMSHVKNARIIRKRDIFMYWTSVELQDPPSAAAWKKIYPRFRVFKDSDVEILLPPDFVHLFRRIHLPSAKSDLARLVLLREYGGLYVDAHVGPTSPSHLITTLDKLDTYDIILFGKGWAMQSQTDFDLMNGVIAAKKGTPELNVAINIIIANMVEQSRKERLTKDYVPYDLFFLCGTYIFIQSFFEQIPPRPQIKQEFQKKIHVHYMIDNLQSGFELAAHYNYHKPGGHWSERQKTERFFFDH